MSKILNNLKDLQKEFYAAIDEAFKAKIVLGEEKFEIMRQDLFDRYIIEREQLKKTATITDKNINFEINLKIDELTPHKCGFLRLMDNEAKKLKTRETRVENRLELDGRTANVEMLEEKIFSEPENPKRDSKIIALIKKLFKHKITVQSEAEPQETSSEPIPPVNKATEKPKTKTNKQLQGQMTLEDLQTQPKTKSNQKS